MLIFATGSNEPYFQPMIHLLESLLPYKNNINIVVWNLGLTDEHIEQIKKYTDNIHTFQFENYPSYFDITKHGGYYAWKPVIFAEMARRYKGIFLWLDARCLLTKNPLPLFNMIENNKLYSPISSGTIEKWTHPQTLMLLDTPNEFLQLPPRSGGVVGANLNIDWVIDFLFDCEKNACQKDIIAPEGSNLQNHRQDQSILSILYYKYKKIYNFESYEQLFNFRIHATGRNIHS